MLVYVLGKMRMADVERAVWRSGPGVMAALKKRGARARSCRGLVMRFLI